MSWCKKAYILLFHQITLSLKVMPFYKMSTDDATIRRNMEEHFINKFQPELNK